MNGIRDWTIRNKVTGEYAHLHSEQECEQRKRQWLADDKATEVEIAIEYTPPHVIRIMP